MTLPAEGDWVQIWMYGEPVCGVVTLVEQSSLGDAFMVQDDDGTVWIGNRQTTWSKIT